MHAVSIPHRRWARVPAEQPATPVLVGLADAETRIGIAAGLVAAGFRVVLARSAAQAAGLLGGVDVVVADPRFVAGVPAAARPALRSTPVLILAGAGELLPDTPARLGATAIFRAPFDIDDVVTIVTHAARWAMP